MKLAIFRVDWFEEFYHHLFLTAGWKEVASVAIETVLRRHDKGGQSKEISNSHKSRSQSAGKSIVSQRTTNLSSAHE